MEYTIHLFNAGGFVMYPLVLFMLAACTILFERIRTYRNINHELQQLSDSIDAGRNSNNWSTLENSIKNSDDALRDRKSVDSCLLSWSLYIVRKV